MTPEHHRRLITGPLTIEITDEDILEALAYPGRPPGQWLTDLDTPSEELRDAA